MFNTFPELGIEFAKEGAAVVLHTTGATVDSGAGAVQTETVNPSAASPAQAAAG